QTAGRGRLPVKTRACRAGVSGQGLRKLKVRGPAPAGSCGPRRRARPFGPPRGGPPRGRSREDGVRPREAPGRARRRSVDRELAGAVRPGAGPAAGFEAEQASAAGAEALAASLARGATARLTGAVRTGACLAARTLAREAPTAGRRGRARLTRDAAGDGRTARAVAGLVAGEDRVLGDRGAGQAGAAGGAAVLAALARDRAVVDDGVLRPLGHVVGGPHVLDGQHER